MNWNWFKFSRSQTWVSCEDLSYASLKLKPAGIDELANNPRPPNYKKLKGSEAYRIRVANYRIVYTIEDVIQLIEIQRVRHRKDVYRT